MSDKILDEIPPMQGQTKTYVKSEFPLRYKYESAGTKAIRISSNLSNLVVRGDVTASNPGMENQLVYAKFNPGLSAVPDYCFANCTNLVALDSASNIKSVGNYAFLNCKSLSSASFLGTENQVLTHIGDYAFAGSGLKSIVINLQGSVSDSSTNTHCFANCTELTSVDMTKSTYMADHMFDGCTKLQRVTLNDYHSYINEYVFANCTMLSSITLPKNTYMLADHMFDGCVNLREVKFQEPSQLRQLGAAVFAGCSKLTSVTLPASVDDLSYIDPEFLSGSSVDRVVFRGLSDDWFVDVVEKSIDAKFDAGKMYSNNYEVLENAAKMNIPVFTYWTDLKGCGYCQSFYKMVTNTTEWKKWMASQTYYFAVFDDGDWQTFSQRTKKLFSADWGYKYYFPFGLYYWKDKDTGQVHKKLYNRLLYLTDTTASLKRDLETAMADWHGIMETVITVKEQITTFGRGENLSVTFVSSTGKEWVCVNDQVLYTPETKVDKYTTDAFKYGIWYYNIREAKEFADQHNLPLLLEFGSKGCDPCTDFKKSTFNNQEFQEEIAAKPCILCKVEIGEGQAFDYPTTTQAYYASHVVGNPKTYIPQLVYYWKKSDGTTYKEIWNYNYRSDPGNANYQTVLNKLDNMLGSYQHDPRFVAPTVRSVTDNYRYYERDLDSDLDGRYFVCDRKTSISEFSEHAMTILTGGGQAAPTTIASIGLGDEVSIQDGAYQYFTVDASTSRYYDLSGVIFVVEDSTVVGLCTFENEIGGNYSSGGGSNTGYWIYFSDTSTRESISKMIQEFEETSTPVVIFERRSLVDVVAVVGESQSLTVQIDIDSATSQDDVKQLAASAVGSGYTVQSISNIEEIMQAVQFNTRVRYNVGFTTWAKKNEYALVDVASNNWSTGAPSELRAFEARTGFDGNSVSDQLPKILVYHGCSSCTADGTTAIYCKKKIEVDYSKDMNYYKNLIEAYASLI